MNCYDQDSITHVDLDAIDKQAEHRYQQTCMNAIIKLMYYYNFKFSSKGHILSNPSNSFTGVATVTQLFIENDTIKMIRGTSRGYKRPTRSNEIDKVYDDPIPKDDVIHRLDYEEDKDHDLILFLGGISTFALISLVMYVVNSHWIVDAMLLFVLLFNALFVCFTVSLLRIENNYRLVFDSDIARLSKLYDKIQNEREKRIADISILHAYDYEITPMEAVEKLQLHRKSLYELDTYYD